MTYEELMKNYDLLKKVTCNNKVILDSKSTPEDLGNFAIAKAYLKSLKSLYGMFESLDAEGRKFFINENHLTKLFIHKIIDGFNSKDINDKKFALFILKKDACRIKIINKLLKKNCFDNFTTLKSAIYILKDYKRDFMIKNNLLKEIIPVKNIKLNLDDYDIECLLNIYSFNDRFENDNYDEFIRKFITK